MWTGEMTDIAVRLVMAVLGTVGFAMLFKVSFKRMPWAALGGLITYAVYELIIQLGGAPMIAAFIAATVMTLYSELFARILRAPAITFLFACAIPIVPGSGLYYTVYNLLFYNAENLFSYGKTTFGIVLGMAVGMSVGSAIVGVILHISSKIKKRRG